MSRLPSEWCLEFETRGWSRDSQKCQLRGCRRDAPLRGQSRAKVEHGQGPTGDKENTSDGGYYPSIVRHAVEGVALDRAMPEVCFGKEDKSARDAPRRAIPYLFVGFEFEHVA